MIEGQKFYYRRGGYLWDFRTGDFKECWTEWKEVGKDADETGIIPLPEAIPFWRYIQTKVEVPGAPSMWVSPAKEETNNWYLPENCKGELHYRDHPPKIKTPAYICFDCKVVFWSKAEGEKHQDHNWELGSVDFGDWKFFEGRVSP